MSLAFALVITRRSHSRSTSQSEPTTRPTPSSLAISRRFRSSASRAWRNARFHQVTRQDHRGPIDHRLLLFARMNALSNCDGALQLRTAQLVQAEKSLLCPTSNKRVRLNRRSIPGSPKSFDGVPPLVAFLLRNVDLSDSSRQQLDEFAKPGGDYRTRIGDDDMNIIVVHDSFQAERNS